MTLHHDDIDRTRHEVHGWVQERRLNRRRAEGGPARVAHSEFAVWLPTFLATFAGGQSPAELAATAVAALLDAVSTAAPDAASWPPTDDFTKFLIENARGGHDERAIERMIVAVLLNPSPWPERYWHGAYALVREMARRIIRSQLRWITNNIALPAGDGELTGKEEVENLVDYILFRIVRGKCDCWRCGYHIAINPEKEFFHCEKAHDLGRWQGETALHAFLKKAIADIGLPNVNGFRHGILAKQLKIPETFCAGQTLRCRVCHREGNSLDQCECEGGLVDAEKPSWWGWFLGQRNQTACRRCVRSRTFRREDLGENLDVLVASLLDPVAVGIDPVVAAAIAPRGERALLEAILADLRASDSRANQRAKARLVDHLNGLLDSKPLFAVGLVVWADEPRPAYVSITDLRWYFPPPVGRPAKGSEIREVNRALLQTLFDPFLKRCGCRRLYRNTHAPCPRCGALRQHWRDETQIWTT